MELFEFVNVDEAPEPVRSPFITTIPLLIIIHGEVLILTAQLKVRLAPANIAVLLPVNLTLLDMVLLPLKIPEPLTCELA